MLRARSATTCARPSCWSKAGECLRAGAAAPREGPRRRRDRGAAERRPPSTRTSRRASALLGEIFREREMHSVAIAKLREALGERELDREQPARLLLPRHRATRRAATSRAALELYEKILAFDYRYEDVEARLGGARASSSRARPPRRGRGRARPPARKPGRYIDPRHARPRRHGHRLQGGGHRARPHRRLQGAARRAARRTRRR